MGYNGNNRGRTHKWSWVGDKRHYNWGLNFTSKAIVAPFAIMAALIDMENAVSSDMDKHPEITYDNHNNAPISVLKSYEDKKDNLHKLYRKVAFIKRDIHNIKRYIFFLKFNIFNRKESVRKQRILTYLIQRRERLISTISLFDFGVGGPINSSAISGRVTIHNTPQKGDSFSFGCICKKDTRIVHKYIETVDTLSIRTRTWQILFFTKAMFLESKKGFAIIPYEDIKWSKQEIINHGLTNTHGYEVYYQTWYHARVDGGPDRRYKSNYPIYSILRYQISLKFLKADKSFYLIFDKGDTAKNFSNIISQKDSFPIATDDIKLLSWKDQKQKKCVEVVSNILAGIIVFCASILLEILFNVPSWELWDGFLIFPAIAFIGTLFVVSLPVGVIAWGTGVFYRTVKNKPKTLVPILSIVAVVLVVFTYLMTINFLEEIGFIHRQSHFYYGQLEALRLVFWGLVSTVIGIFAHTQTTRDSL